MDMAFASLRYCRRSPVRVGKIILDLIFGCFPESASGKFFQRCLICGAVEQQEASRLVNNSTIRQRARKVVNVKTAHTVCNGN